MKNLVLVRFLFFAIASAAASASAAIELFDGHSLTGWYTYLKGYGRDCDPQKAFTVTNGAIHISGETWGSLITEASYENYRLTVEYRFDGTRFPSKKDKALDSGILFHSTGPDGAFAGIWMAAHEYNLIQGASGDFWTVHPKGSGMFLKAEVAPTPRGRTARRWQAGGREVTVSGNGRVARGDIDPDWSDRRDAPLAANEMPIGSWNTAVLECRGDTVKAYFNGRLVNVATHVSPSRGRIQLQSEGCGVAFRRVTLEPLNPTPTASRVQFDVARPVWPKGLERTMNANTRLRAAFSAAAGATAVLRITGSSFYRIRLNGQHVGYGPARAAAGFFRVDEWTLPARTGTNELELEATGYNCNNYCTPCQSSFVQAEVLCDGGIVCATGRAGDFTATSTERMTRVPRYSGQRAFSEVYRYDGAPPVTYELTEQPTVRLLPRMAPYPPFAINDRLKILSRATAVPDPNRKVRKFVTLEPPADDVLRARYRKDEFDANGWRDGAYLAFRDRHPSNESFPVTLAATGGAAPDGAAATTCGSVMLDAGLNDCGFFGATVDVVRPGKLLLTFDEILSDGEVNPARMGCCNVVEWIFEKPGTYRIETHEPYVWRYANLIAREGAMTVSAPFVRTYKNGNVARATFRCSDPALERIFAAARETFAHNAVDVFTDCPSRERAGWLCDSFFIGRVNKLLTGDTTLERLFLENYSLPESFPYLPRGMVPMCYPADHWAGIFIPNWAMWLVFETEEYLARSGDRETVDALRPRLQGIVDFLKNCENSDGLLEKLPSWVFVEWSAANKLVQEVNYPSNMAWAEVLDVMDRLYGMPQYAEKARQVRETIRAKSWNGMWFCDNARLAPDGSRVNTGICTEVCQYYAFFFKTATPETHPELWRRLVDDFGPKRRTTGRYPEIWPANAFVGNYLRLELLAREGLVRQILEESKGFFLYMADRTGTLWEHDRSSASCDHGFASHIVVPFYRDVLGVKAIDAAKRTARVEPPADLDLDWCEGSIPVSQRETLKVSWRKGERPVVSWDRADAFKIGDHFH